MRTLPFKTQPLSEDVKESVGNSEIGIVPIKKLGCLTPNEKIAWDRYLLNLGKSDEDKGEGELVTGLVTIMLRSRVDSEWTEEDTLNIPNYPLVEALLEFFKNERNRWEPLEYLMKFEGKDAKDCASDYAKKIKGVAVTRSDLKSLNIYFVFGNRGLIPINSNSELMKWEVIATFDIEDLLEEQPPKKQKNSIGLKSA